MQPTQVLSHEHRVILRVLASLETGARRLAAGQPVPPAFFVRAAEFIRDFADGCHHRKEEGVLFPALEAAGMPREHGPVGVMLAEHEEGRGYTRAMRAAAEELAAGAAGEVAAAVRALVVENALAYVELLREHIAKEDGVLFPMADRILEGTRGLEVAREFDRIEHEETGAGVHEKYVALADELEREAGAATR